MFRNYLAAALRNFARNGLYAGITVAGLTLGFAVAILIALFVRDEFSYDRFLPGYKDIYTVNLTLNTPSTGPIESAATEVWTAPLLKLYFPQIEAATALTLDFPPLVRRGNIHATEQKFLWGDADTFKVFPLTIVAGDLSTALSAPDGLVLTRSMARKYFGRDAPIGDVLLVNGHPMRVAAVLKDLPSNTNLAADFIGSGLSPYSATTTWKKMKVGSFSFNALTYLRLKPGVAPEMISRALPAFFAQKMPVAPEVLADVGKASVTPHLVALADVHLRPPAMGDLKPAGDRQVIAAIALVGLLIVMIAGINFVTLMTARATRRAVEVGVRKAAGASRGDLIAQFLGEAMIYVLLSMLLAVALAELLLPGVNALLQRTMKFDYLSDPTLAAGIAAVAILVGLLAGAYPAFVLSSFRPAAVLRGGVVRAGGSGWVRQGLVIVQFAILICLVVMTTTIVRQTLFAINQGARVDKDQVIVAVAKPCSDNFKNEVRALPGVKAAACSGINVLGFGRSMESLKANSHRLNSDSDPVGFGFFDVYGVKPLAGRFFQENRARDQSQSDPNATSSVVLNESAVRKLGFASPSAAIGQIVYWHGAPASFKIGPSRPAEIIGVAPDFTFDGVRSAIRPAIFWIAPQAGPDAGDSLGLLSAGLNIKLTGQDTPATLKAIDRIWDRIGGGGPIIRMSVDQLMMLRNMDTIIQGSAIAVCATLALFIACLGLFALSAFTAEQRTKEIGVRKAMGASTGDIVRLLVWSFTQPVLWANLIAWPVAWLVMDHWLHGFAYHVDLAAWTFFAAAAAAVVIAWVTVSGQSFLVARAKPVAALRYE